MYTAILALEPTIMMLRFVGGIDSGGSALALRTVGQSQHLAAAVGTSSPVTLPWRVRRLPLILAASMCNVTRAAVGSVRALPCVACRCHDRLSLPGLSHAGDERRAAGSPHTPLNPRLPL